ncbi:phage antirepressor KilAC domain-containing protein [Methylorubrum extorquens]|uniref:phage antirepressor KilAC domain-containing protein n=1 Tax=Methylorubrum extorquens TaxID=408 RepID=UPI001EE61B42|nr:phage antirepressor KilAC domain-containing protein [Methylorubrum extorquens]MCG5249518.1 phage regulatory protein/antirepressor Ant [Methylorubrum extorquens]
MPVLDRQLGLTGERALAWKLDYIEAFNAMEAELRSRAAPAILDLNDPGALRGLLLGYTEKVLALDAKVVETEERAVTAESAVAKAAPKVEFYDRFAEADGHYGLQNAARSIGAPPNLFNRWLKETFLFYQGSTLMPQAGFVNMGVFEVKVRLETIAGVERACSQTFVTPFGLTFLARRWERAKLKPKGDRDLFGNVA